METMLITNEKISILRVLQSLLLVLCFASASVVSQEKKDAKRGSADDDVVRVSSNLVNLDVIVRDKKGRSITDLKAEDFSIIENGVPQTIESFDTALANSKSTNQPISVASTATPTTPDPFPRNIISLVLDGQTTDASNLKYVRDGIMRYVRDEVRDGDSVALFGISGGLQLLQPFTQDKAKLVSAVEVAYGLSSASKSSEQRANADTIASLRDQLASTASEPINVAAAGSSAAQAMITQRVLEQYVQFRSALSIQQARPVLASLAAICEGLRTIPGKKTLVVFSQGFVAPQALDWQVQSTIDIAVRANVSIYVIDSTGLTGGTPKSGALVPSSALAGISAATSQESRIRAGAGETVFDITRQEGLDRQQDLLFRISGETGGQFIKNTNDIAAGLNKIDNEIRARYTLTYRSTDANFDGSFRKVKIDVHRPDVTVVARHGYYAVPSSQVVPLSPEERKLLADASTLAAGAKLPLSLALSSFKAEGGYYTVPIALEIPPEAVKFQPKGDRQQLDLDVFGVVRRQEDKQIISRLGGKFEIGLTAPQYEAILHNKIFYRQDMELAAGAYVVELFVQDRLSGKMAVRSETLTLPGEDTEFAATAALLSHHVEPTRRAAARDELSEGSFQIRPTPSREFQTSDNLIIFFKIYNAKLDASTHKPLVRVTVTVMKDGNATIKPIDYELSETLSEPVPHLTFAKYVKLKGLAPGKYSALIEVRDLVAQKTLKQDAWFLIVP